MGREVRLFQIPGDLFYLRMKDLTTKLVTLNHLQDGCLTDNSTDPFSVAQNTLGRLEIPDSDAAP